MPCNLGYIPEHLHSNGRPNINEFYVNEYLFRRCPEKEKFDPFDHISLYDISVNRSGPDDNRLSQPDDVLFNTNPENGKGEKYELSVACLQIKELNKYNQYFKILFTANPGNHENMYDTCQICLYHKQEECNYSHCAFVLVYNGIELKDRDIYNQTLAKNRKLRTKCRHEFSKMYLKEEVRINW